MMRDDGGGGMKWYGLERPNGKNRYDCAIKTEGSIFLEPASSVTPSTPSERADNYEH